MLHDTFESFSARSPVFAHLSATMQGLTTIRAFNAQHMLCKEFDHHQVIDRFIKFNRGFFISTLTVNFLPSLLYISFNFNF